ncbi:methyltransferase [Polaribacter sp. MED152]|uniref:methyltransferase n=1 Tax=Polaribacter sp. MED152 TaxID=313598 RepID=UPI000068C62C|nr:methyltransferase [Polaribacter sp. MED152]EAQ43159.1 thiopurine S-methyltransferase (TPMT) [Polaribacter sp. MED152]
MIFDEQFWDNKYITNKTGWDLGQVSPPLKAYFDQLTNKDLKILIPGGGNSHEAEYLLENGFTNVYVIDISKLALTNLKNRVPGFPSSNLIHQNFFELNQTFDLVIEQTFFCALNPNLREEYVSKMHSVLNDNGKLVGLLFDAKLNEDHPPFGGSKKEYTSLFRNLFTIEVLEECYNSIENRKGMELFCKFVK